MNTAFSYQEQNIEFFFLKKTEVVPISGWCELFFTLLLLATKNSFWKYQRDLNTRNGFPWPEDCWSWITEIGSIRVIYRWCKRYFTGYDTHAWDNSWRRHRLFNTKFMPKYCEVLCELVPVLRVQTSGDISHQLVKTLRQSLVLIHRLQISTGYMSLMINFF